jgi:hypothetical protein
MSNMLSEAMVMDLETDSFKGMSHPSNYQQDPYAGLNRSQRRAAMSKERRAFRKRG